MVSDNKRLMTARDTAADAVAYRARTGQLCFSMKESGQEYFDTHGRMAGATEPDGKLESRKLLAKGLAVEFLLYPMQNLDKFTVNKADAGLENSAEDIEQNQSRSCHR